MILYGEPAPGKTKKTRWTPWGWTQDEIPVIEGVTFVITAGHGGYLVEGAARQALSEYTVEQNFVKKGWEKNPRPWYPSGEWPKDDGGVTWLEEDCDWSMLVADLGLNPVFGESFMRALLISSGYSDEDIEQGVKPDGEHTYVELALMNLKRWHPGHPKMQDPEVLEILERVW